MTDHLTTLPADTELSPQCVEYVAANRVRLTLKTGDGAIVNYTMSPAALVAAVNLSVALINNFTAQTLRDMGAL